MSNHEPMVPDNTPRGVFVPIVIPIDKHDRIDFDSLDRLIDYVLAGGVDGLWINGTTGEFYALSEDQRVASIAAVVEKCRGRAQTIAQVGGMPTPYVLSRARAAVDAGVDCIAVLTPYYPRCTEAEIKRHYQVVSEAAGRSVMVYHYPSLCGVSLAVSTVIELARIGVASGIKESSNDLDYYRRLIHSVRESEAPFRCFHGAGVLAHASLRLGGDGIICAVANVVPHLCAALHSCVVHGQEAQAMAIQQRIIDLTQALRTALIDRVHAAAVVTAYKWVLREIGVIRCDAVFEPLQPLSAAEKEGLRRQVLPLVGELSSGHLTTTGLRTDRFQAHDDGSPVETPSDAG